MRATGAGSTTSSRRFQLAAVDGDELVGEVHALSLPVEGVELPQGWDEAFERGMEAGGGNVVSLLAISVQPTRRGQGVPQLLIAAIRRIAAEGGHASVIAPVRPTLKAQYPLIPIERYAAGGATTGRTSTRGCARTSGSAATIVAPAPHSMLIEAPVADWQEWTGMPFPEDGTYVVPGMLAPLVVRDGVGTHVEPNVWVQHSVL